MSQCQTEVRRVDVCGFLSAHSRLTSRQGPESINKGKGEVTGCDSELPTVPWLHSWMSGDRHDAQKSNFIRQSQILHRFMPAETHRRTWSPYRSLWTLVSPVQVTTDCPFNESLMTKCPNQPPSGNNKTRRSRLFFLLPDTIKHLQAYIRQLYHVIMYTHISSGSRDTSVISYGRYSSNTPVYNVSRSGVSERLQKKMSTLTWCPRIWKLFISSRNSQSVWSEALCSQFNQP